MVVISSISVSGSGDMSCCRHSYPAASEQVAACPNEVQQSSVPYGLIYIRFGNRFGYGYSYTIRIADSLR